VRGGIAAAKQSKNVLVLPLLLIAGLLAIIFDKEANRVDVGERLAEF
jgi:hypothetical protein